LVDFCPILCFIVICDLSQEGASLGARQPLEDIRIRSISSHCNITPLPVPKFRADGAALSPSRVISRFVEVWNFISLWGERRGLLYLVAFLMLLSHEACPMLDS